MSSRSKEIIEKSLGGLFFVAAVFCLVRSVILSFSTDIWYDELFTMEFAIRPVSELISLTGRDVHPPLYYIIVRGFLLLGQSLGIVGAGAGQLSPEIMAKLVSVFPFFILIIYSITTVRKHFGLLSAGIFSFAIVSMPQLPEYTTEIRMYSYSILFVTAALLHGFSLLRNMKAGNEGGWDIPDGIAIWLYGAAAAYTHYYAAFSVGIIYGILLVWMLVLYIRRMKDKDGASPVNFKALAIVVVCINLTAICYIPWVSVVLSQVSAVKANYWIQPVGIRSLGSCVKYLFKGYFNNSALATVIAVLLFVITVFLFIRTLIRAFKEKETEAAYTLYAFSILPLLVMMGLMASVLIRPVFVNRYMLPAYGPFWLSIAIMTGREFGEIKQSKATAYITAIAMMALIAVVGCVDFKTFIGNEEYRKVKMDETLVLFDELSSDTIIISNFNHVQALLSYYLNKGEDKYKIYLYQEEAEPLIHETVPGLETIDDPIDIANYLDGGKKVLFLGSFNSREVLLQEWNEAFDITSENEGSYLMERYWFDVFTLDR